MQIIFNTIKLPVKFSILKVKMSFIYSEICILNRMHNEFGQIHRHTYKYTHKHMHTHANKYTQIYACAHIHKHINIYTHMLT